MDWLELWQGPWRKRLSVNENRWIMLDVETSGLDVRHDHLLAIAAIALKIDWSRKTLVLDLADSFEVVLRHDGGASKDNILLHGIGPHRAWDLTLGQSHLNGSHMRTITGDAHLAELLHRGVPLTHNFSR